MYRSYVERHSVGPRGQSLVTFVIEFPRVVLAETVTHRLVSDSWGSLSERTTTPDVSKNSASSRAIPHARFVEKIARDPFMPAWTGTKAGMQGDPLPDGTDVAADGIWLAARNTMLECASQLNAIGVHKQDSNRLLEPWAWVTQVVTATGEGWANFFTLRCHEMAHPALRKAARMMFLALRESTPDFLSPGQWHLPFVPRAEALAVNWRPLGLLTGWRDIPPTVRSSPARCAWVSYENHEKDATDEAVNRTCERLVGSRPVHASPFEHQGSPAEEGDVARSGNLARWVQLRKLLPAEKAVAYDPPASEVEAWPEYRERVTD